MDAVHGGCRRDGGTGHRHDRMEDKTRGMQNGRESRQEYRTDARQECCRTRLMHVRTKAGHDRCRAETGQDKFRTTG